MLKHTIIIESRNWFISRGDKIDEAESYNVDYHEDQPESHFKCPATFMTEFHNVKAHSMPFLLTEDNELISDHVWPVLSQARTLDHAMEPKKSHLA